MQSFLETSEVLQLVVEYVGFSPSRFYLRACSRFLLSEVNEVIYLSKADYFKALKRKVVTPEYLKLQGVTELSDALISKITSLTGWSTALESLIQGRLRGELMNLDKISLHTILECSILRMNLSTFDIAMGCIESRSYLQEIMYELLWRDTVHSALMKTDALEILKRIVSHINLRSGNGLAKTLLKCATEFRAQKCGSYLFEFAWEMDDVGGILGAHSHSGNLEAVLGISCANPHIPMHSMSRALQHAVSMRHLDIATFLLYECRRRHDGREELIRTVFNGFETKAEMLNDDYWAQFLIWFLDGIPDITQLTIGGSSLLKFACDERSGTMCHYLAERGYTPFAIMGVNIALERNDLLDLLDLCCGLEKGAPFEDEPAVELFLVARGVQFRGRDAGGNPVIRILEEGFRASSFFNRVELMEKYLMMYPELATEMSSFEPLEDLSVTPLGAVELCGTPETRIWTGEDVIELAEFISHRKIKKADR